MLKLSPRERQILEKLLYGLSNEEIAGELFLSKETIKMYLKSIFEKLRVKNRVSAAVMAIKLELVNTDRILQKINITKKP